MQDTHVSNKGKKKETQFPQGPPMFGSISPIKSNPEEKKSIRTPLPKVVQVDKPAKLMVERPQDDEGLQKQKAVSAKMGAANAQAVQSVFSAPGKKKTTSAQAESKQVQCDIFPINPPLLSDAESFTRVLSIKRVFFCPIY